MIDNVIILRPASLVSETQLKDKPLEGLFEIATVDRR
jgi:hypothetical protein